jgi:hypothetical protein
VALHSLVSGLVAVLCSRLLARLEAMTAHCGRDEHGGQPLASPVAEPQAAAAAGKDVAAGDGASAAAAAPAAGAASGAGVRQRRGAGGGGGGQAAQQALDAALLKGAGRGGPPGAGAGVTWGLAGSWRTQVQAALAGLLFALHPVHTEVRSGARMMRQYLKHRPSLH